MAELFQNFEINRSPWWESVWRLVASSVLLHIFFLIMVLYVPAIRDAINIAGMLTGVDYVDRAYRKTQIQDEVTMIDTSQKFEYPPGYFQPEVALAPQLLLPEVQPVAPQLPPMVMPTPKVEPTPAPTPVTQPTPAGATVANTSGQNQGAVAAASPTPAAPKDIDKQAEKAAAENPVGEINEDAINKRPLKDWLARNNERKLKGELDLSQNIELTIEAELKPGGKLENARVVRKSGDPRLVEAAKELVAAVSDSNVLFFLQDNKNPEVVKRLIITDRLDQEEVTATVSSEVSSEVTAKTMALVYTALLNKGKEKKKGQDEEVIYNSTKISADGKQIIVNFKMPRPTAETMLKKQIPAT